MSSNSSEYKSPLARKILAIFTIVTGAILAFGGLAAPAMFLAAIAFLLPGIWWFLHERKVKADPTAPRMKRHWGKIAAISALAFIGSVAFTEPVEEPTDTEVSVTTESTTATTSTTSSETSTSTTTSSADETTSELPPREPTSAPVTETTTPQQVEEVPVVIDRCGEIGVHETGTTFYTDGTSGWTQECADEMEAQMPPQQFVPEAPPAADTAPVGGATGGTCKDIGHKTYVGDGIYVPDHDADGDGVGCESYPG